MKLVKSLIKTKILSALSSVGAGLVLIDHGMVFGVPHQKFCSSCEASPCEPQFCIQQTNLMGDNNRNGRTFIEVASVHATI